MQGSVTAGFIGTYLLIKAFSEAGFPCFSWRAINIGVILSRYPTGTELVCLLPCFSLGFTARAHVRGCSDALPPNRSRISALATAEAFSDVIYVSWDEGECRAPSYCFSDTPLARNSKCPFSATLSLHSPERLLLILWFCTRLDRQAPLCDFGPGAVCHGSPQSTRKIACSTGCVCY